MRTRKKKKQTQWKITYQRKTESVLDYQKDTSIYTLFERTKKKRKEEKQTLIAVIEAFALFEKLLLLYWRWVNTIYIYFERKTNLFSTFALEFMFITYSEYASRKIRMKWIIRNFLYSAHSVMNKICNLYCESLCTAIKKKCCVWKPQRIECASIVTRNINTIYSSVNAFSNVKMLSREFYSLRR